MRCVQKTRTIDVQFRLWKAVPNNTPVPKLKKEDVSLLQTETIIDDQIVRWNPERVKDDKTLAIISSFELKWTHSNIFVSFTKFDKQPTICRRLMHFQQSVTNGKCTDDFGYANGTCFNDLLSEAPMQDVDWTFLSGFLINATHYSPNWEQNGGYYVNLQSLKTNAKAVSEKMFLYKLVRT